MLAMSDKREPRPEDPNDDTALSRLPGVEGTAEDQSGATGVSHIDWAELAFRPGFGAATKPEWRNCTGSLLKVFAIFYAASWAARRLDDKVHDTFLIVVQAIQRGDLREPERLMGFVRTIVRRQIAAYIDEVVHSRREELDMEVGGRIPDKRSNPEQSMASHQRIDLMKTVLLELSEKDREVLTRFYLREQTQEEICEDMNLSETQFRLLKSRAKARFGELGRKKLQQRALMSLFMRTSVGNTH